MLKIKILAIGDFHGKFPEKLFNAIKKEKPDLILCTGDFYGAESARKLIFKYWDRIKPDAYGLIGLESLIPFIGKKKVAKLTNKAALEGRQILKKLNKLGLPVFFVYGNADPSRKAPWARLKQIKTKTIEDETRFLKNIKQIEYSSRKFKGLDIAGFGCKYTQKGFRKESKLKTKERIKERRALKKLLDKKKVILLTHEPPYGILDKIKDKKSPRFGQHVGDKIILQSIKKYKPLLHICGHLHENQGTAKIGKTLVVNPGAACNRKYAIIEIVGPKIKVKLKRSCR